eukprot:57943_1
MLACRLLPLVLALFSGIVYGRLIIEKDVAYDITDDYWFNYWFEDDLWAIDRRISYHNTHITQKCIKYEGNNKLCLCKYPNNNDLYYCHHGRSVKSKQHHIAAKNAYKNFIIYDEFDPYGRFAMSFNLDKGKNDNIVAEMGKGDALDRLRNLVDQIKNEFAIMWCFAKNLKGDDFEGATKTFKDKTDRVLIAEGTALAVYEEAAQNLEQEKNEYIRTNKITEKDNNKLEMILEKDKKLDWKTKKGAVIQLAQEYNKKVGERIEQMAAARSEYTRTVAPLLAPGLDEFNKRLASDTVTKAMNSKTNIDVWQLSKTEIAFLVVYVMEDAIASATRAYWRENMNDRYPTLRDLVYGVTHLPVKTNFFKSITTQLSDTNDYLVLWFGIRSINYPVNGKSIGQALGHGVTLRGLWSTSMHKSVAEKYAGCPGNFIRDDGVVFKIKVPKANVGEINGIDVRWVSTEKDEDHGEILIYDIPGEYVYVWKRCYFNQDTWYERQDPSGTVLVPIEAHGD